MPFPTTQWTLIAEATLAGSPQGREALAELFRRDERPVLNQIGRKVRDAENARDLAQAFWLRMVEDRTWRQADAARGRFRQFLSTVLIHFLRDDYRRRTAVKRGGTSDHTALDEALVADSPETNTAADRY